MGAGLGSTKLVLKGRFWFWFYGLGISRGDDDTVRCASSEKMSGGA